MEVFNETPYPFGFVEFARNPGKPTAAVVVKGRFVLEPDGVCWAAPPDFQVPAGPAVRYADDIGNSLRIDSELAPYKPRADCLLLGAAHSPNGTAVETIEVAFSVGPMTKRLWVYGDRNWVMQPDGHLKSDRPEPFVSMPIRAEFAHGGTSSSYNKHGKGFGDISKTPDGKLPMANILPYKQSHVGPWDDLPAEGFGPLDPALKPRSALSGTYDEEWLYKRKPFPPHDFQYDSFNAARGDQQVEGYLRGDEPIDIVHMHPTRPHFRSRLPGTTIRVALLGMVGDKIGFVEPKVHLDTCAIDMDEESVTLIWRARFSLDPKGEQEFTHGLIAEEPLDKPRSQRHYFDRLKQLVLAAAAEAAPPPPPPPPSDEELQAAEAEANKKTMAEIMKALKEAKADDGITKIFENQTDPLKAMEAMVDHLKKLVDGLPKPPK